MGDRKMFLWFLLLFAFKLLLIWRILLKIVIFLRIFARLFAKVQ